MRKRNPVLESAKSVTDKSKHVRIKRTKIKKFARMFDKKSAKHWMKESPFNLSGLNNNEKLTLLFVFNSISFCYHGDPKWISVHLEETEERGTWSLFAALIKARERGYLSLNSADLSSLDEKRFSYIMEGKQGVRIPLFQERLGILKDLGKRVNKNYNSDFGNLIHSAGEDALLLLDIITRDFPFFDDSTSFEGEPIRFHKRAQLLISDIYNVFKGKEYGKLENTDKLTACADYILPTVLRYHGILEYSSELSKKVDGKIKIPANSVEEIEIRANTIMAVEMIKSELKREFPEASSMILNDYLWLRGSQIPMHIQHHLTETIFY